MKDFPSCFGENGIQVANLASSPNSTTRTAQNLVSSVYRCKWRCGLCFITVSWSKHLMGQGLSIAIDNLTKVEIKPWLFSKKKGTKILDSESSKITIFWDLTCAKYSTGPEPLGEFYVAILFNQEPVLVLGDSEKLTRRRIAADRAHSDAICVSKRENIFGKKFYGAKSQLCDRGKVHDIWIECDTSGQNQNDPFLVIRIDSKTVMKIKRLRWKFRGNYTILVDGFPVEVFWDVHDWLFGNPTSNAVFMFQTCISPEKTLPSHDPSLLACSLPFSLILYVWKSE